MNVWYGRTGVGTLRTIPAPLAMSDPAGKADLVAAASYIEAAKLTFVSETVAVFI